jgi:hypothetical protein
MQPGAQTASRWSAPAQQQSFGSQTLKHTMKEKQCNREALTTVPLVGPGSTPEFQLLNANNATTGGKPLQSGRRRLPPVGRPRRSKSNQKGDPSGGRRLAPPPGSFFNEKMLIATSQGKHRCGKSRSLIKKKAYTTCPHRRRIVPRSIHAV